MASPVDRHKDAVRRLTAAVRGCAYARDQADYRLSYLIFQADEGEYVSPDEMVEARREYEAAAEALRVAERSLRAELTPRERRVADRAAPTPAFRSIARVSSRVRERRARWRRTAARSGPDAEPGEPDRVQRHRA